MFFQRRHRIADVAGLLLDDFKLDARRQLGAHGVEPGHHRVHHFHRVHAGLPLHFHDDGGLLAQVGEVALLGHAIFDVAHVANADGRAGDVLDDDVVEVRNGLDPSHRAHAQFRHAANDTPAGHLYVLGAHGALHFLRGHGVTVQLVHVEKNIDLAGAGAAQIDLRHAVHGFDSAPDLFVGDLGQLANGAVSADSQRHDRLAIHFGLLHDGRKNVRRQTAHGPAHLLAHVFHRAADLTLEDEGDHDVGRTFRHHRSQLFNATHRRDRLFHRQHHLRDDLFRTRAGETQPDHHGGRVALREQVHAEVHEAEHPHHHHEHDEHESEHGPVYANF